MTTEWTQVCPMQLELNFLKCFAPIHLLQLCMGSLRVNIRNQCVTNNTTSQVIYRLATGVAGVYTTYQILVDFYEVFPDKPLVLAAIGGAGLLFCVAHYFTMINISFFNHSDNLAVYVTLQKVDNFLKLGTLADLNNAQYYVHAFLVYFVAALVTALGAVFFFIVLGYVPAVTALSMLGTIFIYIEIILMGGLVFYLTVRLKFLKTIFIIKISRHENEAYMTKRNKILLDKRLLPIVDSVVDQDLTEYVVCLCNILSTYKKIEKIYKFQVLLYLSIIFVWAFITIGASVEGTDMKVIPWVAVALYYLYLVFFFIVLVGVVLICNFYKKHITELRLICIQILARSCELENDPVRNVTKKMLHFMENESQVISIYGIVDFDLGLPLKLIALIANFAIILMQFTML